MIKKRSNRDYVCPKCFYRPNKCTCKVYSMTLILIDYNLQPIIQRLNEGGFQTVDCCEGHFGEYKPNIYISFVNPIKSCPEGFKLENKRIIRHIYKAKTKQEFKIEKEEMIKNLNNWINGMS